MAPPVHFAQNSGSTAKPDSRTAGSGAAGVLVMAAAGIIVAVMVIVESTASPAQRDQLFQATHVFP